jgi:hypothetical protein
MKQLLLSVTFVLTLLAGLPFAVADDNRRDGNWWLNQPKTTRAIYAVGFFDGMDLGHVFSFWKYASDKKSQQTWIPLTWESYGEYTQKYLNNVTAGQLIEGLDSFYSDYRNRRIRVSDAVWLVANSIAGTPEEQLNKMIESWRENAVN